MKQLYVNKGNVYTYWLPATDDEVKEYAATLDGAETRWRCLHGHRICESVTSQMLARGDLAAAPHSKCGLVLMLPLPDKETTDTGQEEAK